MSAPDDWKEAMDWWKDGEHQSMIRNLAVARLQEIIGDSGCGISSSDINHTVYHIYRDWLGYKAYVEQHDGEASVAEFLMDEMLEV